MVKIAIQKLFKYNINTLALKVPRVYVEDNALESQEELEVFRTTYDGKDALVIIPVKVNGDGSKNNQLENSNVKEL